MRQRLLLRAPALEHGEQVAQRAARLGLELVGFHERLRRRGERDAALARMLVQELERGIAKPPPRHVDDALEGEVVAGRMNDAEIGKRIANLLALVEARPADHPVRQLEGDEAILELA